MRKLRTEQRGQQTPSPDQDRETTRFDRRLIQGLDEAGVQDFAVRWRSSRTVREQVVGVLTKELDRVILQSESGEALSSPNALATLADLHGYRRALRFTIKLLTNQQETNDQF